MSGDSDLWVLHSNLFDFECASVINKHTYIISEYIPTTAMLYQAKKLILHNTW